MRERGKLLVSRTRVILGVQFVLSALLILMPYHSSLNQLVQMGIMALSALFYVYKPVSAISSILMFNILPTTILTATNPSGNGVGVYYLGYKMSWVLLVIMACIYILQNRNHFTVKRQKWLSIGFGTHMMISRFWAWDATYYGDTFFLLIAIYCITPLLIHSASDVQFLWISFISAGLLLTARMLFFTLNVGTIQQVGVSADSNYISMNTIIILTLCMAYFFDYQQKKSWLISVILMISVIGSVFLIVSYASRTAFLILIAYMIMVTGTMLRENLKAIIALVIIACITIYVIVSAGIFDYLASDFFEENFSTGNGRTLLWAQYIDEFLNENLLLKVFGRGFHVYRAKFVGFNLFAHNSYLSILIDFGLSGLCLFVAGTVKSVCELWKKRRILLAIGLIIVQVFSFALDGFQDAMSACYVAVMFSAASDLEEQ